MSPHQVPMPAQHRGGRDDPTESAGRGEQPGQCREHQPDPPEDRRGLLTWRRNTATSCAALKALRMEIADMLRPVRPMDAQMVSLSG